MTENIVEHACKNIYRSYPEFRGIHPKVSAQPGERSLLIFETVSKAADGKAIARALRVVIDSKGKILKATTSR
jgi:hypothetical protein